MINANWQSQGGIKNVYMKVEIVVLVYFLLTKIQLVLLAVLYLEVAFLAVMEPPHLTDEQRGLWTDEGQRLCLTLSVTCQK